MIAKRFKFAFLAVSIALATVFTYNCSSDGIGTEVSDSGNIGKTMARVLPNTGCNINDYETVVIGTQTWMKYNMDCDIGTSRCHGDNSINCTTHGRLYNYVDAINVCDMMGGRWHLPSANDWDTLFHTVDGTPQDSHTYPHQSPTAGKYLKDTSSWYDCGVSGYRYSCLDSRGFRALPGGYGYPGGYYYDIGRYGTWWTSTPGSTGPYSITLAHHIDHALVGNDEWAFLFSVRCVK